MRRADAHDSTAQCAASLAAAGWAWKARSNIGVCANTKIGVLAESHYSAVFTKPGTYAYYCSIHPQMTATIVVK